MPYLLAAGILAVTIALSNGSRADPTTVPSRRDAIAVAILLLILIPLYCLQVYSTPWQVNTDEIAFMSVARGVATEARPDLFGLSWYFGCPIAAFVFFGKLAQLLGGIDLYHVRLSQSFLGIACVLASYALFRRFMPVLLALLSALLLGVNHSLIAYSRMANWHGSSLFLETVALLFLAIGLQRQSKRAIFASGVTSGLAFYFYFPGRMIIALCLMILLAAWAVGLERRWKPLLTSAALLVLGWGIVTAPIVIASAKAPPQSLQYQREQLLIYPEGRKAAQGWTNTASQRDAWIANASNGLRAFNAPIVDHGWLYANNNHGFTDPATGILLWIGFVAVISRIVRRMRHTRSVTPEAVADSDLGDVIAVVGFLMFYLSLAFLITKAPNYQRMLMLLPFVAYLAATGLWWTIDTVASAVGTKVALFGQTPTKAMFAGLAIAGIFAANVLIFGDFVLEGRRDGHEVGSTGRFVESRKTESGHTWILAADKENLYYWWGEPYWWQGWLGFFAAPNQPVKVVSLPTLDTLAIPGRSTVFIARAVWEKHKDGFNAAHTVTGVANILPNGRLIAVEVAPGKP